MTGTIKESWLARQVDLAARREYAKPALSEAAIDVLCERRRQIEEEGWTPEHDDSHADGEMARAAAAYCLSSREMTDSVKDGKRFLAWKLFWPWSKEWWKPTTPRRDLVKAATLIIAEIERLDRASAKGGEG